MLLLDRASGTDGSDQPQQGQGHVIGIPLHAARLRSSFPGGTSMSTIVMTERTAEASPRLKARIAGVLLAIAGLCYLTNSFANFLSPEFAAHLSPYILIPGVVEIVLALWLFVMGVYAERWKEQASAAGASIRT
ncbi:MAG TPA: DUF4386 family protein [Ktedonobacteraceae bacterium]